MCLPNLLAGGLPAGALPGLALACAADKRAQHTRATQKSTTHARHTKRDAWIYTGDITAAIEIRRPTARRLEQASVSTILNHSFQTSYFASPISYIFGYLCSFFIYFSGISPQVLLIIRLFNPPNL